MTKYLKHYWKKNGSWLTDPGTYVEQHHPEADYPGLGVKVWMHDSDGVDVCLSEVPDSTSISTINVGSKKAVMELTETQYNSVKTPLSEADILRQEANQAELSGDADTAATKNTAAAAKETEAQNALNAL